MKRAAFALALIACAREPAPAPIAPPPSAQPKSIAADAAPPPNEVVRRIISGGEIYARVESSCETLAIAAGRTPEERALEIDTSEAIGCTAKRKTGILLDVQDRQHMRCVGSRHQTSTRAVIVAACPLGETGAEMTTPRPNEAVVAGVRLFSDRAACDSAGAPASAAHAATCFESALAKAVAQRKDDVPSGDFVTRFDAFIDDASSTAWARSTEQGQLCEQWRVARTPDGFTFVRDYKDKRDSVSTKVQFAYDAKCKRVTIGARTTNRSSPGGPGWGSTLSGGWTASLAEPGREDALPFQSDQWFYTRRACERSPRN